MVAGHAGSVGAHAHGQTRRQHPLNGRAGRGRLTTEATDEVLPLVGHAMLDCDPTAQRTGSLDAAFRDGFGVVEEPAQAVKGNVAVHPLEHAKETLNRLVIRRVDAEGPAGAGQSANNCFEFGFHDRAEVRPGLEEVLEVSGAPDQILARTRHPKHVVALARLGHADPAGVVRQFTSGLLGE